MALIQKKIDPDAGAGYDYLSLNAWNTAEATDLVTDQDQHKATCTSSSGSADTTACSISTFDWTTNSTYYVDVIADTDHEALKTGWDSSRYRLSVTDANVLSPGSGNFFFVGLQIEFVYSSGTGFAAVYMNGIVSGSGPVYFQKCRLRGENSASLGFGFNIIDADAEAIIENCIIERFDRYLISITGAATVSIYNNVIAHQDYVTGIGINITSATATVIIKNNAIFDTSDDISDSASSTIDYNGSDDGDGTNSVSPSGSDWDNEFSDSTVDGDYTLLNTGNLYDAGVGPSTDSNIPTEDIDGDTRSGTTTDIAADEYVSGAVTIDATATDGVSFSDTVTNIAILSVSCADGVEMADSSSRTKIMQAVCQDGFSLSDSDVGIANLLASATDGISFSDLATSLVGTIINALASDGVQFSDVANLSAILRVLSNDNVIVGDTSSNTLNITVLCEDGVSFSDLATNIATLFARASDIISLSDISIETSVIAVGRVTATIKIKQAKIIFEIKQAKITIN